MGLGYEMTYATSRLRLKYTKTDCKSMSLTPTIKWNCVDKRNIYQLLRDFYDLQCGNLGQAMCNRRGILWLMFITMPASKYTLFVPAVEPHKWFHALASCVSSLSWEFSLSSPSFLLHLLFSTASCYSVRLTLIFHIFLFFYTRPPLYLYVSVYTHFPSLPFSHTNINFPFLCLSFSFYLTHSHC